MSFAVTKNLRRDYGTLVTKECIPVALLSLSAAKFTLLLKLASIPKSPAPRILIRLQSVSGDEDAIQDRVFDEFRNRDYAMESFEMGEVVTARYSGCGPFPDDHLLAWIVVRLHRPR